MSPGHTVPGASLGKVCRLTEAAFQLSTFSDGFLYHGGGGGGDIVVVDGVRESI